MGNSRGFTLLRDASLCLARCFASLFSASLRFVSLRFTSRYFSFFVSSTKSIGSSCFVLIRFASLYFALGPLGFLVIESFETEAFCYTALLKQNMSFVCCVLFVFRL